MGMLVNRYNGKHSSVRVRFHRKILAWNRSVMILVKPYLEPLIELEKVKLSRIWRMVLQAGVCVKRASSGVEVKSVKRGFCPN